MRRADYSSRGVLPTVVRRCVWSRKTSRMRRPWPALGCSATEKKTRAGLNFVTFSRLLFRLISELNYGRNFNCGWYIYMGILKFWQRCAWTFNSLWRRIFLFVIWSVLRNIPAFLRSFSTIYKVSSSNRNESYNFLETVVLFVYNLQNILRTLHTFWSSVTREFFVPALNDNTVVPTSWILKL